jgi:hypothetical protein
MTNFRNRKNRNGNYNLSTYLSAGQEKRAKVKARILNAGENVVRVAAAKLETPVSFFNSVRARTGHAVRVVPATMVGAQRIG